MNHLFSSVSWRLWYWFAKLVLSPSLSANGPLPPGAAQTERRCGLFRMMADKLLYYLAVLATAPLLAFYVLLLLITGLICSVPWLWAEDKLSRSRYDTSGQQGGGWFARGWGRTTLPFIRSNHE